MVLSNVLIFSSPLSISDTSILICKSSSLCKDFKAFAASPAEIAKSPTVFDASSDQSNSAPNSSISPNIACTNGRDKFIPSAKSSITLPPATL